MRKSTAVLVKTEKCMAILRCHFVSQASAQMHADPEITLRSIFESANWWSELSVILVVMGVFAEFLALFIWAKDMPKSEKFAMIAATFAVALGCGGEWLFGSRATSAARQLSDIVEHKAAVANAAAGSANERTAKLESETAPRDVNKPIPNAVSDLIKQRSRTVRVVSYIGDAETARLAREILDNLTAASVVVQDHRFSRIVELPESYGVHVTGNDTVFMNAILEWLDSSNLLRPRPIGDAKSSFEMRVANPNEVTPDAVIFVGFKPIPAPR